MRALAIYPRFVPSLLPIAAICLALVTGHQTACADVVDPLANGSVSPDLFTQEPIVEQAAHTSRAPHKRPRQNVRPAHFQTNAQQQPGASPPQQDLPAPAGAAAPKLPCGDAPNKPLNQIDISIAEPTGKMPNDPARACWNEINQTSADARCWPVNSFNWEATCFYHNPLYFEETNLERYGYQCGDRCCCGSGCFRECCLQPAASAGHFYASVLALPYCLVAECPGECVYTLGHYRPGNCNPWRRHYPPCDPVATATTVGFWVGMAAAIP